VIVAFEACKAAPHNHVSWRRIVSGALRPFGPAWQDVPGSFTNRPMKRTVHLSNDRSDDPRAVAPRRIELYTGSQERRRWPDETKARIVMESFAPGTVVTQLAQRHGCRPQQIHDWRRLARTGKLALPAPPGEPVPAFVPLLADNSVAAPAAPSAATGASIVVEIADAAVRVSGHPGAEVLLDVFSALRRSRRC
jgi:transposase